MFKNPFCLFNENLNLVHAIAKSFDTGLVDKDDLLQSGYMGLFKASLKYNEALGYKFSTLAAKYIEGEIKKEIKNNSLIRLSNKTYQILKFINKNYSEKEIQDRLHISSKMIKEAISYKALIMFDETKYIKEDSFNSLLEGLNDLEKKVILLKYRHNLSQKDIGRLLKVSQTTISRIIQASLEKMR